MADTTGMHWYPETQVREALTGALLPGASGTARLQASGGAVQTYTATGEPMPQLMSDTYGVCDGFFADTAGADILLDFNGGRTTWQQSWTLIHSVGNGLADATQKATTAESSASEALAVARRVESASVNTLTLDQVKSSVLAGLVDPVTGDIYPDRLPDGYGAGTSTPDAADFNASLAEMQQVWSGTGVM